jgi:hypothetical protein
LPSARNSADRRRAFRETFVALQHRIADVKMRTAAVVADSHAVLERVRRRRARRSGKPWHPDPVETFIPDRSKHTH